MYELFLKQSVTLAINLWEI